MNTTLKKQVQEEIADADEHILKAVLALLKEYNKSSSGYQLTAEQLQIVRERKVRYENGQSKGFTWDEVKARLKPKKYFLSAT